MQVERWEEDKQVSNFKLLISGEFVHDSIKNYG